MQQHQVAAELGEFTCSDCGDTFPMLISDAEAWHEALLRFGPSLKREDCRLVCVECFDQLESVH